MIEILIFISFLLFYLKCRNIYQDELFLQNFNKKKK